MTIGGWWVTIVYNGLTLSTKSTETEQKPTCCWVWFRTTSWKQATTQPTKS